MSTPIAVRPARAEDLEVLVEFNCNLARETGEDPLDAATVRRGVARLLADPALGFYTVAVQGGRVAGCLLITFEWSDWRDGMLWWIQSVYVRRQARRQGVLRRLFTSVRQRAEADPGVCGLRLYARQDNAPALSTYRALGMQEKPYRVYELLVG